jgi:hypothetical protein
MAISEPTNTNRAEWAKNALAVFTAETYSGDHHDSMHPDDVESSIGDLIADLLHFATRKDMDVGGVHRHALDMFEQERAEEKGCICQQANVESTDHDACCPQKLSGDAYANATGGDNV